MTGQIELTRGFVALVDDEDLHRLAEHKWCAHGKLGRQIYAVRSVFSEGRTGRCVTVKMHREILGLPRRFDGRVGDHINGDTLDNRRANLRVCTPGENSRNRVGRPNTVSVYKGVVWETRRRMWCASIRSEGRQIEVGCFADERTAALAYDVEALRLHEDFARLNLPAAIDERELVRAEIAHRRSRKGWGSSPYRGVYWGAREQRWIAKLTHERRKVYIGAFEDEVEAAKAYDRAARAAFGDEAITNFQFKVEDVVPRETTKKKRNR